MSRKNSAKNGWLMITKKLTMNYANEKHDN